MNLDLFADLPGALRQAGLSATVLPSLTDGAAPDVAQGCRLQQLALQLRLREGEVLRGWKVAFGAATAQARFGLNEPVYGVLTSTMQVEQGSSVSLAGLIQPKLEIELAFLLGSEIVPGDYTDEQLISAIAEVAPAFEIADCRWQGWRFGAGAFLSDNAAAALYCLGPRQAFDSKRHALVDYWLEHEGELCGAGHSDGRIDTPLVNLVWLLRRLLADGQPLSAGQVILSGALLAPLDIKPGEYRLQMVGMDLALRFESMSKPD
jgi:2-keto-4-pentenoate hydratase